MTDDDNDGDDFPDALGGILGATFIPSPDLDLDLAFDTADSKVNFDRTLLLSSLSPHTPDLASPPSSAAAREPN